MNCQIAISDLSARAQAQVERLWEASERPVYAKRHGRGHRVAQIHFVSPRSEQYERVERQLLAAGWRKVIND